MGRDIRLIKAPSKNNLHTFHLNHSSTCKQTAFYKDSFNGLSSSLHCLLLLRLHRSFHQDEILSAFSVQWVLTSPALDANYQCLQEHKLYFKLECQEIQKNPSLDNIFLIRQNHVGGKQTSRTNRIDFNYGYMQNFKTTEGNNFVRVLPFNYDLLSSLNYDLLSSLHYRYESVLPYLDLFSLTCIIM